MKAGRIIFGLYVALFVGLGVTGGLLFLDTKQEYDRLVRVQVLSRQRLAEAQAQLNEQQCILERLRSDPIYVEKVIRQKLLYAKPDELIFRFEE